MKQKLSLLIPAALLAAASHASAQGLESIGRNYDLEFANKIPFSWYVGAGIGWDSNPLLVERGEEDSAYATLTIGVDYNTGDRKRTAIDFHASYSPLFYFDAPSGIDDYQTNARLGFDIRHRVNPRLTITDSAYISYEVQPDFGIGATVARQTDEYLYWYNSLAAAYSWTRRFSTVTSYTISGVNYQDETLNDQDFIMHLFGQEFRYAFTRRTTGALTYRFGIGDYDNGIGDYESHYFLVGADHMFSPRMIGSFRVGAEYRDRDFGGSQTDPYFEGSFVYRVNRKTDLRAYTRIGFADNDVGTYGDRFGYRFGVTAAHRLNTRLTGNIGVHYYHDDYEEGLLPSFDEDVVAFSAGIDYALWRNVSVNAGYSFTTSSNDSFAGLRPEYDRHNVQVGINARF
ncbi:MAG TPA: outer membrane beta-barrel protein [Verrucomicrobiales bacterium]|jgi:hypothetical protein|nr:outer membrane beta-barrel protein [Verrucomicrobiales bacterium]